MLCRGARGLGLVAAVQLLSCADTPAPASPAADSGSTIDETPSRAADAAWSGSAGRSADATGLNLDRGAETGEPHDAAAEASSPPADGAQPRPTRPNILLISTDDHALQVSSYGDRTIATPNIDRLASGGVRFVNGYVTQASCSASRSSMFTGTYPHQNGQLGLSHRGFSMNPSVPTLPRVLSSAGYYTGVIGKVHVGPNASFHWDYQGRHDSWVDSSGAQVGTRDVRRVAASARDFMDAAKAAHKPFFLKVSFLDPHTPLEHVVMGLPEDPLKPVDITPETINAWTGRPFGALSAERRETITAYYNCVKRADLGVGFLLQALEDAWHRDDTLVVFLGDHGGGPIQGGKMDIFENGLRVPYIVRYPAAGKAGQVRSELVSTVDVLPTVLDAARVPLPAATRAMLTEGRSLMPLLRGDASPPWRTYLFAEMNYHGPDLFKPSRSVRDGRYKLIRSYPPLQRGVDGLLLFDLEADPHERTNLAGTPAHAETQSRLARALHDWQVRTGEDPEAPLLPGPR